VPCGMCRMTKKMKPCGADRKRCCMERRACCADRGACATQYGSERPRVRVLSEPGCKDGQGRSTIVIIQE
jgi:hypothetical protein